MPMQSPAQLFAYYLVYLVFAPLSTNDLLLNTKHLITVHSLPGMQDAHEPSPLETVWEVDSTEY